MSKPSSSALLTVLALVRATAGQTEGACAVQGPPLNRADPTTGPAWTLRADRHPTLGCWRLRLECRRATGLWLWPAVPAGSWNVGLMAGGEPATATPPRPHHPHTVAPTPIPALERLVKVAAAAGAALSAGDRASAAALQRNAERLWPELVRAVDGPRALEALRAQYGGGAAGAARRHLLLRLLAMDLEARWRAVHAGGRRREAERLVRRVLAGLPELPSTAGCITAVLLRWAEFGVALGGAVAELVNDAAERPFLIEPAARILLAHWHDLRCAGSGSARELVSRALLWTSDPNPARRLAAATALLAEPGRQRPAAVLDAVVERRDTVVAGPLALLVATRLPAPSAVAAVDRLAPLAGIRADAAFRIIAARAAGGLRHAWRDRRGTAARAAMLGATAWVDGPSATLDALDEGGEPALRALLALAALGDSGAAVRRLARRAGGAPASAGRILALENLLERGADAAVRRLALAELRRTDLDGAARRALERMAPGRDR